MTDLTVIKDAFADSPEALLETLGLEYRHRGSRIELLCPFHSDNHIGNAMLKDGRFFCFACNSYADCFGLVRQVNECSFQDAIKLIAEIYGITVEDNRQQLSPYSLSRVEREALQFPKTYITLSRVLASNEEWYKEVIINRAKQMLEKYEKIISLYGARDGDEAYLLTKHCGANVVTFTSIKRECEDKIRILKYIMEEHYGK